MAPYTHRVEPKGNSDTFIVHGAACIATDAHSSCTHDARSKSAPAGRTYTIDITDLMGPDLAVRSLARDLLLLGLSEDTMLEHHDLSMPAQYPGCSPAIQLFVI